MKPTSFLLAAGILAAALAAVPPASAAPACWTTEDAVWHARYFFLHGMSLGEVEAALQELDCPTIDLEDVYCDLNPLAPICLVIGPMEDDVYAGILSTPVEAWRATGLPTPGDVLEDAGPGSFSGATCPPPRPSPKVCEATSRRPLPLP